MPAEPSAVEPRAASGHLGPATQIETEVDDSDRGESPSGEEDGAGPTERARFRLSVTDLSLGLLTAAAFTLVLALHGFLPGLSQPTVQAHLATGSIDCLRAMGPGALTGWCDRIGLPIGQPLLSGLPKTYAGLLVSYLPWVTSHHAHVLIDILTDAAGFYGVYRLACRFGAYRHLAVLASLGYLSSLTIVFINGFAATFNGFVMLPFHVWVALVVLDAIERGAPTAKWLPILSVNTFLIVFTDGYAFMATSLVIGTFVIAWAARRDLELRIRLIAAGSFAATTLAVVAAYLWYVPGGAYDPRVSIDYFRAMGADAATFVLPQHHLWWAEVSDASVDFRTGWGDYGAYRSNYLGAVLTLITVVVVWRSRRHREVLALAGAAVVALVLSLGPSLKVYDLYERDVAEIPTAYFMPPDEATLGLPTTVLYSSVPGFDALRAPFRWVVVPVCALFVLGAAGVSRMWRGGRRTAALVFGVVALIEVTPDYPEFVRASQSLGTQLEQFRTTTAPEFPALVRPGERVLLLPSGNDFLANTLVPRSGARSYNVGIDKNALLSRANWPIEVIRAADGYGQPEGIDAVVTALSTHVDAVVFPFFDMSLNAQVWPPTPDAKERFVSVAAQYSGDPRFDVVMGEWFAVIRLA